MERIEDEILEEIEWFCEAHQVSENAFGLTVNNNHKLVSRLRDGKSLRSDTINAIRKHIGEHA